MNNNEDGFNEGTISKKSGSKSEFLIFLIGIFSSILVFINPSNPVFGFSAIVLALIVVWFILLGNKLRVQKSLFIPLAIIWSIYFYHWFMSPTDIIANIRTPVYILSTIVWVLILPQLINSRQFIDSLSVLGSIFVLVGLPSIVTGRYLIGPLEITAFHSMIDFPISIELYKMKSIFANPNSFGVFMLGSVLSCVGYYIRQRNLLSIIMLFLSSTGLFLSNSRGAMIGTIAGIFIIISYMYGGPFILRLVTITGTLASIVFMLSVLRILPIPIVETLDMTGRDQIWRGTARAILDRLVLGYGPGDTGNYAESYIQGRYAGLQPHNSYLRLFLTTGLIGGLSYLIMIGKTALDTMKVISDSTEVVIFAIFCAILVNQVFAGDSLFGLSSSSAIGAIALGFSAKFVRAHLQG